MRVLIADDHDLLRDTLVLFLAGIGDIETAAVGTFAEAWYPSGCPALTA